MRSPMGQIEGSHGARIWGACGSKIDEVGSRGTAAKISRSDLQLRLDGSAREAALLRDFSIGYSCSLIFSEGNSDIKLTLRYVLGFVRRSSILDDSEHQIIQGKNKIKAVGSKCILCPSRKKESRRIEPFGV